MKKNLSVAGKKYQKQDRSEGTEWINVGVLNTTQDGKEYILLDPKVNLAALPIGDNGMVMVGVFAEQQNNQQQQNQGYNNQQQNNQQNYNQNQQGYNQNQQQR